MYFKLFIILLFTNFTLKYPYGSHF